MTKQVYKLRDPPLVSEPAGYYTDYASGVPIAIDLGTSSTKIGLCNSPDAFMSFPTQIAKYRERRINKTLTFIGNDCYLDSFIRSAIRHPFDGSMITNWEYVEWLLDYTFAHLGVNTDDKVDNPILMTELMATPVSQRSNMSELLFEAYGVPKVQYGLGDLFSFHHNKGQNGIVIGAGNRSTNIIPVIAGSPVMKFAKRINFGGEQSIEYLSKWMNLKYPYLPQKLGQYKVEQIFHDHCYVSEDYITELDKFTTFEYLEEKDVVLELPFTEIIQPVKSEEEIQRQLEKKREQGKRLQEQAQKLRLEKLVEKERDFEYYSEFKTKLYEGPTKLSKKAILIELRKAGFDDEQDFTKYLGNLEKSLKRARNQDIGDQELEAEPKFELLEIDDDKLTEEQLKEKRQQKMQKANYEARKRAKEEKLLEKQKKEEEEKKEAEWRARDLQGWIEDKRSQLKTIIDRKKQRKKLRDELNDRKSHAAQMRMKNIASLASDGRGARGGAGAGSGDTDASRAPKRVTIDNDPNDTFGANDEDWAIYRDISKFDDPEELELEDQELNRLEQILLKYDTDFDLDDLYNSGYNWKKSILHKFLRGAHEFDPENQHHQHQVHVNLERIKVPEIFFQPHIAGLDQAGISELCEHIVLKRLPSENFYPADEESLKNNVVSQDIFLTGGVSQIPGFDTRLVKEFTGFLPVGSNVRVRRAEDPVLDAWKGMRDWALTEESRNGYVTRKEYDEMGGEYIKEHRMGNRRN